MKKNEKEAVMKLVRHMQSLQRQIAKPSRENATDEEVLKLFELFWEWTPYPTHRLPSKIVIENLVALMRGFQNREYCYISRENVARIIREESARNNLDRPLSIYLNKDAGQMSDTDLYTYGRWNYKDTPLIELLWNIHCNSKD